MHGRRGIEHTLVHVHVDGLGAVLHLLTSHRERFLVVVLFDEPGKAPRARHVRPLADVDEVEVGSEDEWLQTGEARAPICLGRLTRGDAGQRINQHPCVLRRAPATRPGDVQQAFFGILSQNSSHVLRALVVATHLVGESRIRVQTGRNKCYAAQILNKRPHLLGAERAIQPEREELGSMSQRRPEGFYCLPDQRAPALVHDGA